VQTETFEHLRALNHEFYQTFAKPFADKRPRLQAGVVHALQQYPPDGNILDLGCGHGVLAQEVMASGFAGTYLGLDLSSGMVAQARKAVVHPRVRFLQADLSLKAWADRLPGLDPTFAPPYPTVYSFASLHHVPGAARRGDLVREVSGLIQSSGLWILSVWDFLQSERLRERILPWSAARIDPDKVEQGDTLIDWRHEGRGLRYVHHFTPEELQDLGEQADFDVLETFRSDGENGRLGLYQVWKKR
jgi:tRNA (uracil-5-)-methyltransferase TRM9